MALMWCCTRERVSKCLYVMQLFILAGMVYYFFHGRPVRSSEDDVGILEVPKRVGETLRPVWGPADKCYPVTQNRGTENRKWQARLPSQRTAKVTSPVEAALEDPEGPVDFMGREGLGPPSKENKHERKAAEVYGEEPPTDRGPSWVTRLLRGLWADWFSAPNLPKTQNR
ncbi:uncharacterized protein LOC144454902 isoform X1 [Phascolarctos cinereus]